MLVCVIFYLSATMVQASCETLPESILGPAIEWCASRTDCEIIQTAKGTILIEVDLPLPWEH